MQYSAWFTPAAYVKDTVFGIYGFVYNQAAPAVTQTVLDNGTVLVFGKLDGYNPAIWPTDQVAQLPIGLTYKLGATTYTDTWSATITSGNIQIQFINNLNYYGSIATAHQFRYVVIPGGVKISAASRAQIEGQVSTNSVGAQNSKSDYLKMTYHEVCALYNIPE